MFAAVKNAYSVWCGCQVLLGGLQPGTFTREVMFIFVIAATPARCQYSLSKSESVRSVAMLWQLKVVDFWRLVIILLSHPELDDRTPTLALGCSFSHLFRHIGSLADFCLFVPFISLNQSFQEITIF